MRYPYPGGRLSASPCASWRGAPHPEHAGGPAHRPRHHARPPDPACRRVAARHPHPAIIATAAATGPPPVARRHAGRPAA